MVRLVFGYGCNAVGKAVRLLRSRPRPSVSFTEANPLDREPLRVRKLYFDFEMETNNLTNH